VCELQILARVETTLGEFPRCTRARAGGALPELPLAQTAAPLLIGLRPTSINPSRDPLHNQSAINLSGGRTKN